MFSFKIGLLNIPSTSIKLEYLFFNESSSESAEHKNIHCLDSKLLFSNSFILDTV